MSVTVTAVAVTSKVTVVIVVGAGLNGLRGGGGGGYHSRRQCMLEECRSVGLTSIATHWSLHYALSRGAARRRYNCFRLL